jgi:hypothetical protein
VIDGLKLAKAFIEEAQGRVKRNTYTSEPHLSFQAKWRRMTADRPVPSAKPLAAVIEAVFWATTLSEERRPCRPRLVYSPRDREPEGAHFLRRPLPVTAQAIRKLAPAHASVGYLSWKVVGGRPVLTGFRQGHKKEAWDMTIAGPSPGTINLGWYSERLVSLNGGELKRYSKSRFAGSTVVSELSRLALEGRDLLTPAWLFNTIDEVLEGGHGGSFWIVGNSKQAKHVIMGYELKDDRRPLFKRFRGAKEFQAQHQWLLHVARLTAIDGAVLLDGAGRTLGFGCFMELKSKDVPIRWITPDVAEERSTSFKMFKGGRHRAAVEFCSSCKPAFAIVVSEDGRMIAMAGAGPGRSVICAEVARMGMYGGTFP